MITVERRTFNSRRVVNNSIAIKFVKKLKLFDNSSSLSFLINSKSDKTETPAFTGAVGNG